MEPLYEVKPGALGEIFWYQKSDKKLTEPEIEKIRAKSMSQWINHSISSAYYEPGPKCLSPDMAIHRGWEESKKQVEMIENGTIIKNEAFLIDDPSTLNRISKIEEDSSFRGWVNSNLIDQIREYYENCFNINLNNQ